MMLGDECSPIRVADIETECRLVEPAGIFEISAAGSEEGSSVACMAPGVSFPVK